MEVKTFQYQIGNGWSIPHFPELDSENTLIIIFAAPEMINAQDPLKELKHFYPNSKIIGCSTAGEIAGSRISDKSLSVAVVRFDKTTLRLTMTDIAENERSMDAGSRIAKSLNSPGLRGIFVLSEGLNVNGSELAKGLSQSDQGQIVVTGGLAGDGSRFQKTWVIYEGEILQNAAVAVGLYGSDIRIGHASKGGWDFFGPERRITRSKNTILYELDQKPALQLYKEYLGERASGLPATGLLYPLAIRRDENDQHQLVRTILGVNEQDQSLIFAGDVPAGYLAQLMRANFDRLIGSASEAGEQAVSLMKSDIPEEKSVLSIAISCVGRRMLLGERTEEEIESVLDRLPKGAEQVGFYSYGELSPYTTGNCDLHNQTMTLTTFTEN